MKLIQSLIVAAAFAIPAVSSFAQSDTPVSRAQVRAELAQIEQAGYQPGAGDQATYPVQIQAAEARVTAQNNDATGYGGVSGGSSSSGASLMPTANIATKSIYSAH